MGASPPLQVLTGKHVADEHHKHDQRDHNNQRIEHTNPPFLIIPLLSMQTT
jgi:hypothetical protein